GPERHRQPRTRRRQQVRPRPVAKDAETPDHLPRFISLEGGEGCGKSTQARLLAARLEEMGADVILTREPGGTPSAEAIRGLLVSGDTDRWRPMTEALLHTAARVEHVERVIRPALARGAWVISDRFLDSTRAYQGLTQGLGLGPVDRLQELAIGDFRPTITLLLDMAPDRAAARITGRAGREDRDARMGAALHARLRDAFHELASLEPERSRVSDCDHPLDEVSDHIWRLVRERFKLPA